MGLLDFLFTKPTRPSIEDGLVVPKVWSRAAYDLELLRDRANGTTSWKREALPLGKPFLLGVAVLLKSRGLRPSAVSMFLHGTTARHPRASSSSTRCARPTWLATLSSFCRVAI